MKEKLFKIIMSVTVVPGLVAGGAILALSLNDQPQPGPTPVIVPEEIELHPDSITMNVGTTKQLTATVKPTTADQKVRWSIENPSPQDCVEVSTSGVVTAKKKGTATIKASPDGYPSLSAVCQVTVEEAPIVPTRIELLEESIDMTVGGDHKQLHAEVFAGDKRISYEVEWSSDPSAIASVDSYGLVTAHEEGTATIYVNPVGFSRIFDSCIVNVTAPEPEHRPTGITIDHTSLDIEANKSFELTAKPQPWPEFQDWNVTWDVQTNPVGCLEDISWAGNKFSAKARSQGRAIITATADGTTHEAICVVNIKPCAPTKITLDKESLTLTVNKTSQLSVTVEPEGADQSITWSSDPTGIVEVDSTGHITPLAKGSTTITVKSTNYDLSASCKVDVIEPAPSGTFSWDLIEGTNEAQITKFDGRKEEGTEITIPSVVYDTDGNAYPVTSLYGDMGRGEGVFFNVDWITKINIPASVVSIPQAAVWSIGALQEIRVDESNEVYTSFDSEGKETYSLIRKADKTLILGGSNSTIPEGVLAIGECAFKDIEGDGTANITFPSSLETIGIRAFENCRKLKYANLENTKIVEIPNSAFYGCYDLESFTLPSERVTSLGANAFRDCSKLTSANLKDTNIIEIPNSSFNGCSSLTSITLPNSLQIIGDSAFNNCVSLTSITLPDSLQTIDNYAFNKCEKLSSVEISEDESQLTKIGNDAFAWCCFESFTIPKLVTYLGNYVFYQCSKLEKLHIPSNVTNIGAQLATYCSNLGEITVDQNNNRYSSGSPGSKANCIFMKEEETHRLIQGCKNTKIPDVVKRLDSNCFLGMDQLKEITIPDGVTYIGGSAFEECSSLQKLSLPESVTYIGGWAFMNCSSLTKINIPNQVKIIDQNTFRGCGALSEISLSKNLETIGNWAFRGCSALTSITLYNGLSTIGQEAFEECKSLKSINIPASVTTLGGSCFSECTGLTNVQGLSSLKLTRLPSNFLYGCEKLTTIDLPESITSIGGGCFNGCTSLASINLPPALTSIDSSCFYGCSSLTSLNLPVSLNSIGENCFAYSGIKSITIPTLVENIPYQCFNYSALETITLPARLQSISEFAFNGSGLLKIKIPSSVNSVANFAFYRATKLSEIDMTEWDSPPTTWGEFKNIFGNNSSIGTIRIAEKFKEDTEMQKAFKEFFRSIGVPVDEGWNINFG